MSQAKKYTEVAKFFITKKEEIKKDVPSRKGKETRKGVTYCVYSCPRKDNYSSLTPMMFEPFFKSEPNLLG